MTRTIAILIVAGAHLCCPAALAQDEDSPAPAEGRATVALDDLLEQVSASSGKKFLVHAMVSPRIYVGGTDVEDPGYPVLLSILRNNGLAAAEIEGYVNILPDAAIRQLPLPIVQRDDADIPDDEWVTRVITVRDGNAAWLVPILRPLIPQNGHLAAMATEQGPGGSNKLFIIASYAKVKHITALVELLTD